MKRDGDLGRRRDQKTDDFLRRSNIRENPPLVFSSAGDIGDDARVDGGGSESRRKLARSEVLVVEETASRGSNFFMGTRPDGPSLGDGAAKLLPNVSAPEGMFTVIGVWLLRTVLARLYSDRDSILDALRPKPENEPPLDPPDLRRAIKLGADFFFGSAWGAMMGRGSGSGGGS